MSTSSFTGTIKNFSPKPDEDYYGIFVDNGNEEKWLNGKGNPKDSWQKGDKVKIRANMDEFIEIEEINVISGSGSSSEGSTSNTSAPKQSGDKSGSEYLSKDERINRKVALKEAAETVRENTELDLESVESGGQHIDNVKKLANGYYNILQNIGEGQ